MALIKVSVISKIEVLEDGQIQVRRSDRVLEDGIQFGSDVYHRHVVAPGQDLSGEDSRVRAVAQVIHTPQVIAAYQAALTALE